MALVLADRVRETTTTAGTGTITLLGAVPSCQSFAVIGNGNTTYYTIVAYTGTEYEVGIGTYTASGTLLSRDTVLASSNGGSLVNFSIGTKDVFVDYPAGRAVYEDAAGNVDGYPITGGTINNTVIGGTTPAAGTFTTLTATGQTSLGGVAGSDVFRVLRDNTFAGTTVASFTAPQFSFIPPQSSFGAAVIGLGLNPRINSFGSDGQYFSTNQAAGFPGTLQAKIAHTASAVNYVELTGAPTNNAPTIGSRGSDTNINFAYSSKGTGGHDFYTAGTSFARQFTVANTASAVNFVNITGAATGGNATISAQGSDTNLGLSLSSKGTRAILFYGRSFGGIQFATGSVNSAVNYFLASGAITGNSPVLLADGSDTNISQVFQSKGTGAIDLAAGSSGVNISNGGTVTALTVTNNGSTGYTSHPTPAITAPTTAGGVQATASSNLYYNSAIASTTIVSGGTGYTVGNTLTVSGGTFTAAATFTVSTVSGGVVTAVTATAGGTYSVIPTGTLSVTGGTGSGFTFTINGWAVRSLNITNAGSGYVEQPTVTFSGGGGSGAAAYATVGSGTLVKSIGSTMDFYMPSGIGFSIADGGVTGGAYAQAFPNSTLNVLTRATGSGTNLGFYQISKGTGGHAFTTNSTTSALQFNVSHTASAVNYVQSTGAATGNSPVISAQGSDANIQIQLQAKGTGLVRFATGGGLQAYVSDTVSAVNYVQVTGSSTGNDPTLSVQGSDTNINFAFVSKGSSIYTFASQGGSSRQFRIDGTSASVNYLNVSGSGTGSAPALSALGTDTNIDLNLTTKGTGGARFNVGNGSKYTYLSSDSANNFQLVGAANTANLGIYATGGGSIRFYTATGLLEEQLRIAQTASAVNFVQIKGGATGVAPLIQALGSDTNIPLVLQPKGTGALQANQTDSTATGGNARGSRAVDLQMGRDSASQVADGAGSVIGGGYANRSGGNFNVVAGGNNNTATYSFGVIGGGVGNSLTANSAVIAGGASNVITFSPGNNWSFIGAGQVNTAHGVYNLTVGGYGNSGTSGTSVTTQSATMNGTTAVTLSGSNASIKVGQYIIGTSIAADTYVAAISGTSLTLSKVASGSSTSTLSFFTPHGVVVGGGNNQATGSYSFIGGGGDAGTAANRNVASGDRSVVVGGVKNTASGEASFVGGGGSYAGGFIYANTASANASAIVGGIGNTASGLGAFVGAGFSNVANGTHSIIVGGVAGTTRSIVANHVFPACSNPVSGAFGASQTSLLVLGRETTNATPTVLTCDQSGASTINQIILPNNSAYYFKGSVIANVTGAANGASWSFEGAIMRGANAASTVLIDTPSVNRVASSAGATAWVVALSADTTNGGLAVTVTGAASTTIRWVCKAETTEVTF
jgi:hypothetical protein